MGLWEFFFGSGSTTPAYDKCLEFVKGVSEQITPQISEPHLVIGYLHTINLTFKSDPTIVMTIQYNDVRDSWDLDIKSSGSLLLYNESKRNSINYLISKYGLRAMIESSVKKSVDSERNKINFEKKLIDKFVK